MNDASGPKGVPDASLVLALTSACMLVAIGLRRDRGFDLPRLPVFLVLSSTALGLAMVAFRTDQNLDAIASDLGTYFFLIACLIVACLWREELLSDRTVHWFALIYIAIALFAWYAAVTNLRPTYWWLGRWDPPYFMLLGALALIVRHHRSLAVRWSTFIALGAMVYLGLESGNRTQFLLGAVFVFLAWASNRTAVFLMLAGCLTYALLLSIGILHNNPFGGLLAESRFSLVEGGLDDSLLGRLDEMRDVWFNITTFDTPAQSLLGRGHGAGWLPINRPRLTPSLDGYVYYIHIGFVGLGYKLGLLGLFMFCYWQWVALKCLARMFDRSVGMGARFWYLGGIGFSVNYFLQNSLFDPPAVLAMAMLLVLEHQRRTQTMSDGHWRNSGLRRSTHIERESHRPA